MFEDQHRRRLIDDGALIPRRTPRVAKFALSADRAQSLIHHVDRARRQGREFGGEGKGRLSGEAPLPSHRQRQPDVDRDCVPFGRDRSNGRGRRGVAGHGGLWDGEDGVRIAASDPDSHASHVDGDANAPTQGSALPRAAALTHEGARGFEGRIQALRPGPTPLSNIALPATPAIHLGECDRQDLGR